MEPDMKKRHDALASAVAAVRVAAVPRAKLIEEQRAAERREARRERDAERRETDALRDQLAAIAPAADAWFARWVRAGRLKLVLEARPDLRETRIGLPRFYIADDGAAVWHHEAPHAGRGRHRWYDFALGRTHSIRGGLSGTKFFGGVGGELGTVRTLAELARKKMRYPPQRFWDGMQKDVLRVGIRVADLLRKGELEQLVLASLQKDAANVAARLELERAEVAMLRGEPGGERRYRKAVDEQGLTNEVVTSDMLVHIARRTGPSIRQR
jgi:hypothetical protein